jgi:hypothetical protein
MTKQKSGAQDVPEIRVLEANEIDEVNGGFSPSTIIWSLLRFLNGIGVL